MRSAFLRGREQQRLGGFDLVAEAGATIALSIGGARKIYAHTDPNEDAAAFALGPGGCLVAVADGHGGFEAAETALDHLIENPTLQWTERGAMDPAAWRRHAVAALVDANATILREAKPERTSRTTLAFALARPEEDLLLYATIGDSHLFLVTPSLVDDLAAETPSRDMTDFLGQGRETVESLADKVLVASRPLAGVRAVLLATDGISERAIGLDHPETEIAVLARAAAEAPPDLRPITLVRSLVDAALAAHRRHESGDNVACAALWLEH